jgi:catechol 2,3-dioxygenase-like lactoylglutathione lyase family enzyme
MPAGYIDHVTIRLADLAAGRRFYGHVFELLDFPHAPDEGAGGSEWNDFSISRADADHPETTGLHVAFAARSRAQVDSWWRALTDAGYADDGAPGPRPQYSPDYYSSFVLDPGGNSAEAVHNPPSRDDGGVIDHLWIRVRDLAASTRFFAAVAPVVGLELRQRPDRTQVRARRESFMLLEGTPTRNLHLAFGATDRATVDEFHRVALRAGGRDNGPPGERPVYHAGYYGAYALDPDGNNVEAVFHDR